MAKTKSTRRTSERKGSRPTPITRTSRRTSEPAASPRIRISPKKLATVEEWLQGGGGASVEKYFALPKAERRKRLGCVLQQCLEEHLAKATKKVQQAESRLVDSNVDLLKAMLREVESLSELISFRQSLALENTDRKREPSMLATIAIVKDGDELLRGLRKARAMVAKSYKALEQAVRRWDNGIAAASSRLLASYLRSGTPANAIEMIGGETGKSTQDLRKWLHDHAGDLKADGPKKTADRAIAPLLRVSDKSVQPRAVGEASGRTERGRPWPARSSMTKWRSRARSA
jgi:hypothetical protein